jgi:hypothetical protein
MMPNGYVSIDKVIDVVGRRSYGEQWRGNQAEALIRITSQVRYRGPRTDTERLLVSQLKTASEQQDAVIRFLQSEFRGTPPSFDDAVPVTLIADDDGSLLALPPQIWINDRYARYMLLSGRISFVSEDSLWRWSPRGRVSGRILLSETALAEPTDNREGQPASPDLSGSRVRSSIRTNRNERAEAACREWIGDLVERPANKSAAYEAAKAAVTEIGYLSEKAFERAWAGSAKPEWKGPGARKGVPRRRKS